ncbi:MAG: SH3 domain-containing protein [Acidaminococcaceae bacterium]
MNRKIFSKQSLLAMLLAVGLFTTSVATAATPGQASIRTVSRTEGIYDVEYPLVYDVAKSAARNAINADIDQHVQSFYKVAAREDGKAKARYTVHKNGENILSMSFIVSDWSQNQAEPRNKTVGLNYHVDTGKTISLSEYFSSTEVAARAKEGLEYVHGISTQQTVGQPDSFYVDEDGHIIAIYAAGKVAAQATGELEIDLSALEGGSTSGVSAVAKPVKPVSKQVAKPVVKPAVKPVVRQAEKPATKPAQAATATPGTTFKERLAAAQAAPKPVISNQPTPTAVTGERHPIIIPEQADKKVTPPAQPAVTKAESADTQVEPIASKAEPVTAKVEAESTKAEPASTPEEPVAVKAEPADTQAEPAVTTVSSEQQGVVKGLEVRLRVAPGTKTVVSGYFNNGETVTKKAEVVAEGMTWYQVTRTSGETGWMAAEYFLPTTTATKTTVAATEPQAATIQGTEVRLRSEPSTNSDILDYFTAGESVEILARQNVGEVEWCQVRRANGSEGWVAAAYCY